MEARMNPFTAARIRRFKATGMAVQKSLPFERQPNLAAITPLPMLRAFLQRPRRRRSA